MNGTSVRLALPPTLQPSANNARWADADDALLTLGAYRSHASTSPWKADMMEDNDFSSAASDEPSPYLTASHRSGASPPPPVP